MERTLRLILVSLLVWTVALTAMGVMGRRVALADSAGEACRPSGLKVQAEGWRKLARGLEVQDFRIGVENETAGQLVAVRLDPAAFWIRLRWQPERVDSPPFTVSEVARMTGAAVVVNAGYFDTNGRPLGFFQMGGKIYNRRLLFRGSPKGLHLGAVFYVRSGGGGVSIATREKFDPEAAVEAFQAGPYLVQDGKPSMGLEAYREFHRPARRTVLALERGGRLLVLVSEREGRGLSWCELQAFLVRAPEAGGLGAAEAMNLDGGSSSQLYVRVGTFERHLPGRRVPAFVVIVPREAGKHP